MIGRVSRQVLRFSRNGLFGRQNVSLWIQQKRSSHVKPTGTIFEIYNGVGGSEAMLFTEELLGVYCKYFVHKSWSFTVTEREASDLGGLLKAKLIINSVAAFENLLQEAGVHRVQRVPRTEKHGRMHTSTVTIAITPQSILDIKINERDLEIQTKRSSGAGGQHVNKTESAIRITHKPTGIAVESQETKHQIENRKNAMAKLLCKLREVEMAKITSQVSSLKRSQLGTADRNQKIRTYNFPNDRLTDHRTNKSYGNLRGLMSGDIRILEKVIRDFHEE